MSKLAMQMDFDFQESKTEPNRNGDVFTIASTDMTGYTLTSNGSGYTSGSVISSGSVNVPYTIGSGTYISGVNNYSTPYIINAPQKTVGINWDKVVSIDDLKMILKATETKITVGIDKIKGMEHLVEADARDFDPTEIVKMKSAGVKFKDTTELGPKPIEQLPLTWTNPSPWTITTAAPNTNTTFYTTTGTSTSTIVGSITA
jgi:hypothetical protein